MRGVFRKGLGMSRGIKRILAVVDLRHSVLSLKPITAALTVTVMLSMLGSEANGAASKRKLGDANGKKVAPTQEDYADFTSTDRADISESDKKKADELRLKTIASIGQLLKTNIRSEQKFELLLRLGELYAERHDYMRDLEMNDYTSRYETWQKSGRKGVDPKVNDKISRGELVKSANAFRKLVTEYPKHPRTDAALYALAKTLGRLDNENAELYFKQLLKSYPQSPLIPEAHLALGEYYFDKHNISKAMDSYKSAMKYKESKVYPYAVYKLGWAYYNSDAKSQDDQKKNADKALTAFKLVVALADKMKEKGTKLNLRQEAINDLVLVWAETERVDEAWDYFKKIDEQVAFYDLLEKLGNIYVENGEDLKAVKVYSRLLNESPDRKSNPEIHAKLVGIYERTGKVPNVVSTLKEMSQIYVFESTWLKTNAGDKDILTEAKDRTERNIHRLSAMYHARSVKTSNENLLRAASEIYKLYLRSFPTHENAYELRYYLADVYFVFKQWESASDEYLKVANERAKGKYLKDAALNAVVALNKADLATKYPPLPPAGQVSKAIPLPRVKSKLIIAIDNYVKLLPSEDAGNPMRFTAAQVNFDYGHYDGAIARFEGILNEIPKTKQGENSLKVIMAYFNEKKDWDQVIARSRKYLNSKAIVAAGHKPVIEANLKNAMFQKGLTLEKEKKFAESAAVFLSYQSEFPTDKNAAAALYNATLNFYKVADIEAAVDASKKIMSQYPDSPVVPDVMGDLAQTYEALAEFENAAVAYSSFAAKFPKEKRASSALYNAATLYRGLNLADKSIEAYRLFAKMYPSEKLVPETLLAVAQIQEKKKDYKSAATSYQSFMTSTGATPDDKILAHAKVSELNVLYLDRKTGLSELDRVRKFLATKGSAPAPEARRIVAGLMFKMTDAEFEQFMKKTFTNGSTLQKDAEQKQRMLVATAKKFESIIELGSGEFTVASLYRLGEMHENFSSILFAAPSPTGATQAEVDQFKSQVEKLAFPLKEESVKFFEAAYSRSKEVETFTDWTVTAYKKMVELEPAKHPSVEEQALKSGYIVHDLKIDQTVANLVE